MQMSLQVLSTNHTHSAMETFTARVDLVIRAEDEGEAEEMVSALLNSGVSLSDEPRIADWSWGGSAREEYQTPVRVGENPFEHFNARVPRHIGE
jgi:hypothetical protein